MQTTILDQRFLENLKQRLSISNRRSIYLNALPSNSLTRLDLAALNHIQENFAQTFLDTLWSKSSFKWTLQVPPTKLSEHIVQNSMRRLSSILIEQNDYFAEQGVESFGFGYPILLRRDSKNPERIIKTPLFIWSLKLERNWRKANEWIITREEDFSVASNLSFAAHLFNDASIKLSPIYDHLMDDGILDKEELSQLLAEQFGQLVYNPAATLKAEFLAKMSAPVQALPLGTEVAAMSLETPQILWSGVFGLFRSQKESIIKDIEFFIENFNPLQNKIAQINPSLDAAARSSFMKHTFAMVDTDPSQQLLLHALGRGENLIIQGPPGTGKSQTLSAILSNALSNGGRCLVVCEKKTALEVLFNNLKNLGLGELAIIIEDIYRDRTAVVNSVRDRMQHSSSNYKPSPNYIRLIQSCANQVQRLQGFHKKLVHPISGDDTWSTIVAKYLDAQEKFPKERLTGHLKPSNFKFTLEELDEILHILEEAQPLYQRIGTLQHPFNAFHERFFQIANTHQVHGDLKKSVQDLLAALDAAQRDLLTYLYQYETALESHYTEVFHNKSRLIDEILDIIEDGLKASKYYFNKTGGLFRNMLSGVGKYKKLKDEKLLVLRNYALLKNMHGRFGYFSYSFIDLSLIGKSISFEDLKKDAEKYNNALADWYSEKDAAIREYVNNLSVKNLHPHVDFKVQAKDITRNLDLFAHNFMKSQIFKVPFGFKNGIIRSRLNNLEELVENVQKLQEKFDDFTDYHPLKYFWLKLSEPQQAAFQGLAQSGVDDWMGYFKSWYYYHLLSRHADEQVPQEENYRNLLKIFHKEQKDLQAALIQHSLLYWRSKQTEAVKNFNQKNAPVKVNGIYNLRGNTGGRRTPLRQVFEVDPELFCSFFPVLLVSPSVCASMLALEPGLFDVVIFDEASQLRLEDTFSALVRGKYKIISGDSQQMPPSDYFQATKTLIRNEDDSSFALDEDGLESENLSLQQDAVDYLSSSESLLEYAISDGNYKEAFLQVHYRSKHPHLIDFSNAAFYGKRLTPMPSIKEYNPIEFETVDGLYEEGVNKIEADKVLNHLLTIAETAKASNQKCPSVGVATFNLHQRNHILERIQELSLEDIAKGELFEMLFNTGLFVKNLENIQGDERDVLIISTTFGKRKDGSFLQNFGPINRQLGYRLLNVIVTRAKEKLLLISSIPSEYYSQYRQLIQENGNTGKGILYAYIAYAQATNRQDEATRLSILKLLFEHCAQKPLQYIKIDQDSHLFKDIVFNTLKRHLEELQWEQNAEYAGIQIPILVRNTANSPAVAIYFDVFHDYYSEEAYVWDIFREQHLQRLGIEVLRVWSYNWWQNSSAEQLRLITAIQKKINEEL